MIELYEKAAKIRVAIENRGEDWADYLNQWAKSYDFGTAYQAGNRINICGIGSACGREIFLDEMEAFIEWATETQLVQLPALDVKQHTYLMKILRSRKVTLDQLGHESCQHMDEKLDIQNLIDLFYRKEGGCDV